MLGFAVMDLGPTELNNLDRELKKTQRGDSNPIPGTAVVAAPRADVGQAAAFPRL